MFSCSMTPVLNQVTSSSQCKISLWGIPYVSLCPCILRCATAHLGPDPRSCLHPRSRGLVLWLMRSLFLRCSQRSSYLSQTLTWLTRNQMERNMLTQMICQTSKDQPGKERERESERERMYVCWKGDGSLWVTNWVCLSQRDFVLQVDNSTVYRYWSSFRIQQHHTVTSILIYCITNPICKKNRTK